MTQGSSDGATSSTLSSELDWLRGLGRALANFDHSLEEKVLSGRISQRTGNVLSLADVPAGFTLALDASTAAGTFELAGIPSQVSVMVSEIPRSLKILLTRPKGDITLIGGDDAFKHVLKYKQGSLSPGKSSIQIDITDPTDLGGFETIIGSSDLRV